MRRLQNVDDSEPSKVISSKEANECYEKLLEYFSTQSAESESFETDLDRMTEIGRRLEEIKEERKGQAKITVMFDFQKNIDNFINKLFYIYNTLKNIFSNYRDLNFCI